MNRGNKAKKVKTIKGVEGQGKETGVPPPNKKLATEEEVEANRKRQVLGNITNAAQKKTNRPVKGAQGRRKVAAWEPRPDPGVLDRLVAEELAEKERVEAEQQEEDSVIFIEEYSLELEELEKEEEARQQQREDAKQVAAADPEKACRHRLRGPDQVLSGSTIEQESDFKSDEPLEKYKTSIPRNPPIPDSRPLPRIEPPEDFKFRLDSAWIARNQPPNSKVVSFIPLLPPVPTHLGVRDIDREQANDWTGVATYAREIFEYYRLRERKFLVQPYMDKQTSLTPHMRAILVDWLVELQENYELNHETLYLGVRIIDSYLSHVVVPKERLQITGAVCLYIACKYDERIPPSLEDLIFICDGVYERDEFMELEREIFRTIQFEIGMPLSYRFLRRYARCAETSMETLTLARYILEMSLMDYQFVGQLESCMAAAALYLALRMKNEGTWDANLQFHSGYQKEQIMPVVQCLNLMLTTRKYDDLKTVKSKYAHKVFHQVAKIPLLSQDKL